VGTRSVVRMIEAGGEEICPTGRGGCGERVKFSAQTPSKFRKKVVANIYWQSTWNRIEVWHLHCYGRAGYVYGVPTNLNPEDKVILDEVIAEHGKAKATDLLLQFIDRYRRANVTLNLSKETTHG
jgi:hypothetical protein